MIAVFLFVFKTNTSTKAHPPSRRIALIYRNNTVPATKRRPLCGSQPLNRRACLARYVIVTFAPAGESCTLYCKPPPANAKLNPDRLPVLQGWSVTLGCRGGMHMTDRMRCGDANDTLTLTSGISINVHTHEHTRARPLSPHSPQKHIRVLPDSGRVAIQNAVQCPIAIFAVMLILRQSVINYISIMISWGGSCECFAALVPIANKRNIQCGVQGLTRIPAQFGQMRKFVRSHSFPHRLCADRRENTFQFGLPLTKPNNDAARSHFDPPQRQRQQKRTLNSDSAQHCRSLLPP